MEHSWKTNHNLHINANYFLGHNLHVNEKVNVILQD
jgi:hypothetical protein